jgi:hypothetical protein
VEGPPDAGRCPDRRTRSVRSLKGQARGISVSCLPPSSLLPESVVDAADDRRRAEWAPVQSVGCAAAPALCSSSLVKTLEAIGMRPSSRAWAV